MLISFLILYSEKILPDATDLVLLNGWRFETLSEPSLQAGGCSQEPLSSRGFKGVLPGSLAKLVLCNG